MTEMIDKISKIPQFYGAHLNHAKDKLVFYWDITGRLELYVMEIKTKEHTQISHGEVPRNIMSGFIWTRDDKNLIFGKDADGNEQHDLYLIELKSGDVTQLTDTPKFQEHVIHSSPDGKYILFSSTRNGQVNLFRLDLENKDVEELTTFPNPVGWGKWSPSNDFIIFSYNDTLNLQNIDIWIMNGDGSEQKKLLSFREGSRDRITNISKDGKLLAITSDFEGMNRAGMYNLDTNEVKWFGDRKQEEYSGRFTEDKNSLICTQNYNATIQPIIYNVITGEKQELIFPPGIVAGTQLTANDQYLITVLNSSVSPSSLIKYDLNKDTYEELIQVDFGDIDKEVLVKDQYVEYESTDNLTIGAILYRPKDIASGKKLPALISVHGGPTGQYFRTFYMFSQILVNNGYVILMPNFRGSTGYGRAFQDMNIMDVGGGDLEDIVAGAEFLKTLDYVDPNRIGIFGGSYGGYMTYLATTKKPNIWKLGAASMGISDWLSLYEESMPHFKYFLESLLGKPKENEDLWKDRSGYHFAQNLKCPLLIVHGEHDPRCPISQARIFRKKLLDLGWQEGKEGENTFEYQEYGDIGHGGFTDQEFRSRSFKLMLDFFQRRL
jgi:dipeptidyl aminopeptidase/acylaminoacyl peptidase